MRESTAKKVEAAHSPPGEIFAVNPGPARLKSDI